MKYKTVILKQLQRSLHKKQLTDLDYTDDRAEDFKVSQPQSIHGKNNQMHYKIKQHNITTRQI
jgi:hypothetical protein